MIERRCIPALQTVALWRPAPLMRYSERSRQGAAFMDFSHRYLLLGLLLAGVPVLLHLLMRQKPKRLPFPAFRFLKQRYRTNQRKLNLQNLLLLLLRIGVIGALCLALAKPLLFAQRTGVGSRPARVRRAAVRHESQHGVRRRRRQPARRQQGARRRNCSTRWPPAAASSSSTRPTCGKTRRCPSARRKRIDACAVQPGAGSLNRSVDQALKLLEQQDGSDASPPRILYVFSDRTRASWDAGGAKPVLPAGVKAVYVDVGADKPRDLGIETGGGDPVGAGAGAAYEVRVRLRGTPGGRENVAVLDVEGTPTSTRIATPGWRRNTPADVIVFEDRKAPEPPANAPADAPVQLTVRLRRQDSLTVNDVRYATFLVRRGRKLLTIVGDEEMKKQARSEGRPFPSVAWIWDAALGSKRSFAVEYRSADGRRTTRCDEAARIPRRLSVSAHRRAGCPVAELSDYVKAGGGLAIVPAGDELTQLKAFNDGGTRAGLLPAALENLVSAKPPVVWEPFSGDHPLLKPFVEWSKTPTPTSAREDGARS